MFAVITRKTLKLIIIYSLVTALCLVVPAGEQAKAQSAKPVMEAGYKFNAEVGTFVEVPFKVSNFPEIAGFQFDLSYDPEVAVVMPREAGKKAVQLGEDVVGPDPLVNILKAAEGVIRVIWVHQEDGWKDKRKERKDDQICLITFKILSDQGTKLTLDRVELVDIRGAVISNIDGTRGVELVEGFLNSNPPPPVETVNIPEGDQTLKKDDTVQLTVDIGPEYAYLNVNKISWSSNKPEVATVDAETGLVTVKGAGEARITVAVSARRDIRATVTVTVKEDSKDPDDPDPKPGDPDPKPDPDDPEPKLAIDTPERLPHAYLGELYEFTFTTETGSGPYRWSGTGLPAGLSLSSGGRISGTPARPGRFNFAVTVRDSSGEQLSRDFVLWVAEKASSGSESGFLVPHERGAFKNLVINHGSMAVNLQPHQLPFTTVVGRSTASLSIQASLYRTTDRLEINGTRQPADSAISIPLIAGTNNITVSVQSSPGDEMQYNITVFKVP